GGNFAGRIENAHDRVSRDRLAGAGFANQRDSLALADAEADVIERAHDAGAGAEFDAQSFDAERRGGRVHVRLLGSTMSRNPSPSRLKQNTAIISAAPGKTAFHHSPEIM